MRIAYVFQEVAAAGGIRRKVLGQAAAWAAQGHEVQFFVYAPAAELAASPFAAEVTVAAQYFEYPDVMQRGRGLAQVLAALRVWQPDVIYTRWTFLYPALVGILRRFPTVVEVNSAELEELKQRSRALYLYALATNLVVERLAAGFVAVTRELAGLGGARRRRLATVVSNGINLSQYEPFAAPANPSPRLVFMATDNAPWHGLDKILACSAHFAGWHLDIIGLTVPETGAGANVTWHGRLERAQYDPILARADVAWGSMALHRKDMEEACPLKTREYLAHGLPVIVGYVDTDLDENTPGVLHLPNAEGNVSGNLARIGEFVEQMRGQRVPREAVAHLDTAVKERQRVAFFETVTGQGKR